MANREIGMVRVVVDLRVGHDGQPLVEQAHQGPDDPGLGLAALPEEDHVVTGQDGVLQLGQHGVLEAEHPGDQGLTGGDARRGIAPDLLGHGDRPPPGLTQPAEGGDVRRRGRPDGEVEGRLACVGWSEGSGVVMGRAYAGRPGRGASGRPGPGRRARGAVAASFPSAPVGGRCFAARPQGWNDEDRQRPGAGAAPGRADGAVRCGGQPARSGRERLDHVGGRQQSPRSFWEGPGAAPRSPPCARTRGGSSRWSR